MKSIFVNQSIQLSTIEVADAEPLAGELFQRSFNAEIPDFPKHFVFLASIESGLSLTLGYVHFTRAESIFLCGGMCVNTRSMRYLDKQLRQKIKAAGGPAYIMLSSSLKQLKQHEAVFGYVGHKGSYRIGMAEGFAPTHHQHLIVNWQEPVTDKRKLQLIQQAHELCPF